MTEGVKQAFLMEREFQSQAEISSKSRVDGYDDFILSTVTGMFKIRETSTKHSAV